MSGADMCCFSDLRCRKAVVQSERITAVMFLLFRTCLGNIYIRNWCTFVISQPLYTPWPCWTIRNIWCVPLLWTALQKHQNRYLSSKQLGFLAQNYHALRHKHGITPTFVNDAGFDPSRAVAAHAAIVEATSKSVGNGTSVAVSGTEDQRGNGAGPVFAVGESILARRRAHGGDGGWGDVSLEKGWYKAEVVKVKHGGTPNATYTCRYTDG